MFTHWEVNRAKLASRVLFQRPAHYVPETILRQHVQERVFPDRKLRRKAPDTDLVAFQAKCNELRLLAAEAERANPVSFAIGLTLSPLRLGIAGMTLSGQTNSTTLNILLGVRRSDLPLPPPPSPPTFSGLLPLFLCPLSLGAPAYFAPTGCGSVGALLLR